MKTACLFLSVLLIACNSTIKYPPGGYNYPGEITANDTNCYYYPIKILSSKRDSFDNSFMYLFYRPFDEPNLSLRPLKNETFRLSTSSAFGGSLIAIISRDEIVLKTGDPSLAYSTDTSGLTPLERVHLKLLNKYYPIDTASKSLSVKKYLDSMSNAYPELLDSRYYNNLYKKSFTKKSSTLTYKVVKRHLSAQQYTSLINNINASGFWSLPSKLKCDSPPNDGAFFVLEANTKTKYQIVQAYECEDKTSSKFQNICKQIIRLSKTGIVSSQNNSDNIVDTVILQTK